MGCDIYGQEKVKYWLSIVSDPNSAIQDDTLDWMIEDKLLDGTSNTDSYTNQGNGAPKYKVYKSKGDKTVTTIIDFVDGWGNTYQQTRQIVNEAKVYEPPVLGLSWTPTNPVKGEETTFTQSHDDVRDDTIPKAYGRIDSIDVDMHNDDTFEYTGLAKGDPITHTFGQKYPDVAIKLKVTHWDGWENQVENEIWHLQMANIPPVSKYSREELGSCTPKYKWTATSTDEDDDESVLTYHWRLEQDVGGTYNLVDEADGDTYEYQFQYEGDYRISLTTTDDDGASDTKQETFSVAFTSCSSGSGSGAGKILIQPNRWQMIAVPVNKKVKEYFCDRLESIAGKPIEDLVEVAKAFPSADVSHGMYLIYKPGLTNPANDGNFRMMATDGTVTEIVPFLLSTYDFGDDPIEFTWDSADGD